MKKLFFAVPLLLIAVLFACKFSSGKATVPEYVIKNGHPRIFLTEERLLKVRNRCIAKNNAQSRYYKVLKDYADKFAPTGGKPSATDCLIFAFLYAVGPLPDQDYSKRSVDEYGRIGAELLSRVSPPEDYDYFKRYTPALIASYDWLFPIMNQQQRSRVYTNFTHVADQMQLALKKKIGGRFRESREMFAFYGLAFYGDGKSIYPDDPGAANAVDQKARTYTDFFVTWWRDQDLSILETSCKGGGYPAGTMYGESPYAQKLWPFDVWGTAGAKNLYDTTTSLTGYPLFWLYQMIPYPTHVRYDCASGMSEQNGGIVRFGDYRYIGQTAVANKWNFANIAQAQGVASQKDQKALASVYNWLIQYQGNFKINLHGGPYSTDKWIGADQGLVWDLIFREGGDEAKSPGEVNLPLTHLFGSVNSGPPLAKDFPGGRPEGAGIVVARSSWDSPDATLFWFKASSTPVVHDHRDQGSFQIYKNGWLAVDSGQYEETPHRGNYTARTIAHNSILVYRPGEELDANKADPVWYGYANDGGQRWVKPPSTMDEALSPEYFMGGITEFKSVPNLFDFFFADITRAYNSSLVTSEKHKAKVSLVTRSVIYLRPDDIIVMLDNVNTTNEEFPKRWLMHSIYRPKLNGHESFSGTIPFSRNIPGKPEGVSLQGDLRGGISESRDTGLITINGWNFGPSDGRLLIRTLLPERRITRLVGGGDNKGMLRTSLAMSYESGDTIYVRDASGISPGDFVYLGETNKPYDKGMTGKPSWPVDDVYYQGWGKVENVDFRSGRVTFVPYRYNIPKLQAGAVVLRSSHANSKSFEFMDAEYNQWEMKGESVANAGPYNMQHGNWRIEVEPLAPQKNNLFLHVLLPCNSKSLARATDIVMNNILFNIVNDNCNLEIQGAKYKYSIKLHDKHYTIAITDKNSGKLIYKADN